MHTNQHAIQSAKTAGEAAAIWWASVLRDPKLDNGDDSPMMNVIIAMSKERRPSQTMDTLERFAEILAQRINQKLIDDPHGYTARLGITLGVDYHPDMLLSDCAEQAGLRGGIADWPWKTHMWVKSDEVAVRYGYGAAEQVIWTKQS